MDGGVSAIGSVINASWRIATVVYELKAVGEQTRDLLDTTSQVSSTLQHAQVLRRQRSGLLNVTEKKWIDDVLHASERAVGNVAALIEPARVDMQTQCNKIRLFTRGQFILRDSPKVQVQLGRFGIAAQGLNTAMGVLCTREGSVTSLKSPADGGAITKVDSGGSENELKPPPSYEVVELLDRRRESVLKRRASKLPMAMDLDAELNKVQTLEEDPNSAPMVDINVAEVQPTPVTSPQPNRYAESDGLQVVENYWSSNPWASSSPDLNSRGPSPMDPSYSRLSASSLSSNHHHHHRHHHVMSRSRSPSTRALDSNTSSNSDYLPYRPPGPPPPQRSWQQPPIYNYPPPPSGSVSTSTQNPPYTTNNRQPPNPPSPHPPYSTHAGPQPQPNQIYTDYTNPHPKYPPPPPSHPYSTSRPSPSTQDPNPNSYSTSTSNSYCRFPDTTTASLDPHLHLYTNTNTTGTSHPHPHPHPHSLSRPPSRSSILTTEELSTVPRQKGRARGRAWLEHQLER